MPRKYRINEPGYHHVINRGVERRVVFVEESDYNTFLKLLTKCAKDYDITVHSFVLMNNHYHILLETKKKNLSEAIQFLNGTYSIYFNKKYKRTGHLWQSRFFSNYLFDDEHFWIVAKYIERNPIKANIVKELHHYKYQSFFYYKYKLKHYELIKNSKITNKTIQEYESFIVDDFDQQTLQKIYTQPKAKKLDNGKIQLLRKRIEHFFNKDKDINRAENIKKAYEYGYTKTEIANFLNLSTTSISRILL